MNALIINNGYPNKHEPNIYIFVHKQALALKRQGCDVVVLDIDLRSIRWKRRYGVFWDQYEKVEVLRISFPFVTVKFRRLNKFLNSLIGMFAYKKIIKKYGKIDVIHSHFVKNSGWTAMRLNEKYKIPYVITEHSSAIMQGTLRIDEYKKAYEHANVVIAVSDALKRKLNYHGVMNVKVIPNVIDTDCFPCKMKHSNEKFTFLSVGSLIPRKRFGMLLEAIKRLQDEQIKCALIIIGSGSLKSELQKYIRTNNIENVTFIDSVPNSKMTAFYQKSDCFVLASDAETFGMVYAEAISCGCPAIATNNGGSADVINECNGMIVEKNSIDELVSAMKKMIEHASDYNVSVMHKDISDRFGIDVVGKLLVQQYKEIYR